MEMICPWEKTVVASGWAGLEPAFFLKVSPNLAKENTE